MQRGNQARESSCLRILIEDDDEDSRHLTAMRLARAGYLVDEAHDGEQGWEALAATRYDLLITDHSMRLCGEGSGYGALRLTAVVPKALDSTGLSEAISSVFNTAATRGPSNRGASLPTPPSPPQ